MKPLPNKIVDFVLTHHWYDLIKSGEKRIEYREDTEFWRKRIKGKTQVRFRRGYTSTSMLFNITKTDKGRCPYKGWDKIYLRIYFEELK